MPEKQDVKDYWKSFAKANGVDIHFSDSEQNSAAFLYYGGFLACIDNLKTHPHYDLCTVAFRVELDRHQLEIERWFDKMKLQRRALGLE